MPKNAPERLFGAHESVSGGLHTAFQRVTVAGGTALQIFTRNQRQWASPPVTPEEARAFAEAWRVWGEYPVFSHASYLLNPASPDEALRRKGVLALAEELARCRDLGIAWTVLHPGAAMGADHGDALGRVASSVAEALDQCPDGAGILLENTAGQGTGLGARLEDLARIMEASGRMDRLGLCLDTCHAFAAGYAVDTPEGIDAMLGEIDMAALRLVHVNDCKGAKGSRLDRHEHIGKGSIGLAGFRAVVNHPALAPLPMVLETHKGKDMKEDVENLRVLRSLVKKR